MRVGHYFITKDKEKMQDLRAVRTYQTSGVAGGGKVVNVNGVCSEPRFYNSDGDDFVSAMIEWASLNSEQEAK